LMMMMIYLLDRDKLQRQFNLYILME
jgi:hypothetical protein